MKVEDVARICHEANRAYCLSIGDAAHPSWEDCPDWQKQSIVLGVTNIITGETKNPKDSHSKWYAHKFAEGWSYGPVKDPEKKLHPCMVAFHDLSPEQQTKDYLFWNIVTAVQDLVEMPE